MRSGGFSLPAEPGAPISCPIMTVEQIIQPLDRASTGRKNLVGLTRSELAAELAAFGAEPFRARQLWHWIYHRGATDFDRMTSLSKAFRATLAEHYEVARPRVSRALASVDGTR